MLANLSSTFLLLLLLSVHRLQNHFLLWEMQGSDWFDQLGWRLTSLLLLGGRGNAPIRWGRRCRNSHVALVWRGRGSGTDVSIGGGQIHPHNWDHGLGINSCCLASLWSSFGFFCLGKGCRRLLSLDNEGPDPLLGRGGGDDEAEPDGEDDAEGDGGRCQPARNSNSCVQAGNPVWPLPVRAYSYNTSLKPAGFAHIHMIISIWLFQFDSGK